MRFQPLLSYLSCITVLLLQCAEAKPLELPRHLSSTSSPFDSTLLDKRSHLSARNGPFRRMDPAEGSSSAGAGSLKHKHTISTASAGSDDSKGTSPGAKTPEGGWQFPIGAPILMLMPHQTEETLWFVRKYVGGGKSGQVAQVVEKDKELDRENQKLLKNFIDEPGTSFDDEVLALEEKGDLIASDKRNDHGRILMHRAPGKSLEFWLIKILKALEKRDDLTPEQKAKVVEQIFEHVFPKIARLHQESKDTDGWVSTDMNNGNALVEKLRWTITLEAGEVKVTVTHGKIKIIDWGMAYNAKKQDARFKRNWADLKRSQGYNGVDIDAKDGIYEMTMNRLRLTNAKNFKPKV